MLWNHQKLPKTTFLSMEKHCTLLWDAINSFVITAIYVSLLFKCIESHFFLKSQSFTIRKSMGSWLRLGFRIGLMFNDNLSKLKKKKVSTYFHIGSFECKSSNNFCKLRSSCYKTPAGVVPLLLQTVCHQISDLMEEKPRQWHISTSLH